MKKGKNIVLSDKREIILDDDNDISLSIISNGKIVHSFPVAYPSAGYGGGTLLLALSEQYLLFSYYSGQSEEAYMLFQINDYCLDLIYESGYLCGEGASYIFSSNENFLIQALPASLGAWYVENDVTQADASGNIFFEYGEINIFDIKKKKINKHILHVYPSENSGDDMAEEEPFYISAFVDDHILRVMMPWGEKELVFPLDDIIIFKLE